MNTHIVVEGLDGSRKTCAIQLIKNELENHGYGGRLACDINSHHIHDVFNNKMSKYKSYFL